MSKHPHILNAASNLLGIALVIITGLNVSRAAGNSTADEVAWVAAIFFSISCWFSYVAIRAEPRRSRWENWADWSFMIGLMTLIASVIVLAFKYG